ncbi:primosomal protein N' [Beijerinckia indica]|uniref:Replication restart protein PriA n=1 Tax=Beijerinckia indica subsp. indica (strain ATCC 9039 / DSM 1715 / NCIMB 8712) TaxID=395963 RepID=B2IEZ9_BEII9|nr:primosomal protein N' [Beijerinckia indica]ACB94190.1 primosomal protein N' [Beijerinckia indica subsp. indica ATCC 9039]
MNRLIADVLIPVAVDIAYSYAVPEHLGVAPGDFVVVPLGRRQAEGIVWDLRRGAADNLKLIQARLDLPPLAEDLRRFIDWVARWTLSPRGMVLRMAIRTPLQAPPEPPRLGVMRAGVLPARMTPARHRVLEALGDGLVLARKELAKKAACSPNVIDGLIDEGTLATTVLVDEPDSVREGISHGPTLEPDQAAAAVELTNQVRRQTFTVTLLEGVTGSGKTEVYFEAVASALETGGHALILLPEIALTAQFLDRFTTRFGERPGEWHSAVGPRRRARTWRAVAEGRIKVVVGARSALFLPFRDLRLIVVDEEHDSAYKQEDGVPYHARDMAVVRGQLSKSAVILASATPSIETRVNAEQGRYGHLRLHARHGGRVLPALSAIDLRKAGPSPGKWISPRLAQAMTETLARGEQSLLFLNRRGYAPLTLCRLCGHRFQCPHCTAWLVEHRFRKALVCHHCGHIEPVPEACPACGGLHHLTACGPGIERVAEEAAELFPNARTLVLSSDLPGGTARMRDELEAVAQGACDIVIGTQLVAKGHNFPLLSLVGVVDADISLANGDPRASERTFQILRQVTGRAGRFETQGQALIQTWQPEHPVIAALLSGDAERFYAEETEQRRRGGLPPFRRLAALIISAKEAAVAERHARALVQAAHAMPPNPAYLLARGAPGPDADGIVLLGPAPAPITVIRARHRFRLLIKAPRGADLQGFIRAVLAAAPPPRGDLRVSVDIDPQSFL